MGFTTQLDGGETQQKKNNNEAKREFPFFLNSKNAQNVSKSTQKFSEMDLVRIKVILDYWFDEVQKFDKGYGQGNSQNYHKIILQIRHGFIPVKSSRNQVQNLNFSENSIYKSQVFNDKNNQQQKETNIIIEKDTKQIKDKAQIQIEGISYNSTGGTIQQSDQNSIQNQKILIPNVNIVKLTPKLNDLGSQEQKKVQIFF